MLEDFLKIECFHFYLKIKLCLYVNYPFFVRDVIQVRSLSKAFFHHHHHVPEGLGVFPVP